MSDPIETKALKAIQRAGRGWAFSQRDLARLGSRDAIDKALQRIEEGTYGYCVETDEPISIKRLEARPIATLSLEAQEYHERLERTHRDD